MSARARLVLPVVVSLVIQVPAALYWLHTLGVGAGRVAGLVLAIVGPLVLLAARRYPGPVVLIVSVLACADFIIAEPLPGPPYIPLAFAIVGALVRRARLWAWLSVGITWTATLTIGLLMGRDWPPVRVAATTLGVLVVFGIGELLRGRSEVYAEIRRRMQERQQGELQAERVRIARELHDVLAHSLSQINVQAGVGLHLMERQPEKAAEALENIKDTSKTALDEVRAVLGVLRSGAAAGEAPLIPEPDLARLPVLVESLSGQGVDVRLEGTIENAPQAVQLALFRIAQESLTNVRRHSGATRAEVRLGVEGGDYVLHIDDDGRGLDATVPHEGRGLLGMRERAELLGGSLVLARSPWGGTRVTARIPATTSVSEGAP
jgi:signal transduction histidine kinase